MKSLEWIKADEEALRTRKLVEDAAVLCSLYAYFCSQEYDYGLSVNETLRIMDCSHEADMLAIRALNEAGYEHNEMPNDPNGCDAANHWALAASMLLNGEVTP